jgi:hypothetical protein
MLKVTASAREYLRNVLEQGRCHAREEGMARSEIDQLMVRIVVASSPGSSPAQTGLMLTVDRPRQGDRVLECRKENLLAMHPRVGTLLDGVLLDVVETPDGVRLKILRGRSGPA